MSESRVLQIHTHEAPPVDGERPRPPRRKRFGRQPGEGGIPKRAEPDAASKIQAFPRRPSIGTRRGFAGGRRLSSGDRLLRNSAIACAALLGVLTLGNIHQPWAEKAADGIERALTMRIDLDDSLGELTFVRQIMPESALVFLNLSGSPAMTRPTEGEVSHPWSALQPWMLFSGVDGQPVYAAEAGTVTAVSPLSGGDFGVLLDHGGGRETLYAGLQEVSLNPGDAVARGQALGAGGEAVYFEWRSAGESIDPTEALGL